MIDRSQLLSLKRIASRANPRVRQWVSLDKRAQRDELGLTIAVGAHLVREGLEQCISGWHPQTFLFSDSGAQTQVAFELFEQAGIHNVERISVSDDVFAKITDTKSADGLALVMSFERPTLSSLLSAGGNRWLAAAEVQDPGNAGALARTALAADMDGCIFLGGADPVSPKFLRGSMGAAFRLPCAWASMEEFTQHISELNVVAASSSCDGSTDYRKAMYPTPLMLLVGGERGIAPQLLQHAQTKIHIPLSGGVESLNLAVAAGIILFSIQS